MKRRRQYRRLPVWVARVHGTVHVKGKTYVHVTTKTGKPRTLRITREEA